MRPLHSAVAEWEARSSDNKLEALTNSAVKVTMRVTMRETVRELTAKTMKTVCGWDLSHV